MQHPTARPSSPCLLDLWVCTLPHPPATQSSTRGASTADLQLSKLALVQIQTGTHLRPSQLLQGCRRVQDPKFRRAVEGLGSQTQMSTVCRLPANGPEVPGDLCPVTAAVHSSGSGVVAPKNGEVKGQEFIWGQRPRSFLKTPQKCHGSQGWVKAELGLVTSAMD